MKPTETHSDRDRDFLKRALALARRGVGRVSPNPLVGALVVRDGQIVGEGFHLFENRHHAEVLALDQAGARAAGAGLYVNLEPCAHQGRTPPCTDRIVEARIARVIVGTRDPNPLVSGKGIASLRRQGVRVTEGVCSQESRRLNEKFFHYVRTQRPFVLLKLALTLDGKIATATGQSQWITGPRARKEGQRLRFEYDAVLVGVETVLIDNPRLNVRGRRRNSILRVILDSKLRTPADARLFESPDPVIIFHGVEGSRAQARLLQQRARLVSVPGRHGFLDWEAVLSRLGDEPVTSLLIEGGSRVAASALEAGVVQKVNFFYGPKIIGGKELCGIADLGIENLSEAVLLGDTSLKRFPPDFCLEGYVAPDGMSGAVNSGPVDKASE